MTIFFLGKTSRKSSVPTITQIRDRTGSEAMGDSFLIKTTE